MAPSNTNYCPVVCAERAGLPLLLGEESVEELWAKSKKMVMVVGISGPRVTTKGGLRVSLVMETPSPVGGVDHLEWVRSYCDGPMAAFAFSGQPVQRERSRRRPYVRGLRECCGGGGWVLLVRDDSRKVNSRCRMTIGRDQMFNA